MITSLQADPQDFFFGTVCISVIRRVYIRKLIIKSSRAHVSCHIDYVCCRSRNLRVAFLVRSPSFSSRVR